MQQPARPSHAATTVATTPADLLRAILLPTIFLNMANSNFIMGAETDKASTLSPCHDDVRGRPISRRGCSIFDIFQRIHGPGYSREEMDDALRIPSIRNFLFDELRRQNNTCQQTWHPEEAEEPETTDPPMPELERVPTPPPAPRTETICYYHREFGTRARRCRPPCMFDRSCYYCGLRGTTKTNGRPPCSHNQRV